VATRVNRMLWGAMLASLLVYVLVAHVAAVPENPNAQAPLLVTVFVLLSIGVGLGTLVYRRRALVGPIQSGALDPTTPDGAQKAFQPFILSLALSESVGIFGLVLAFLSGNPRYSVAFCSAAMVLMFLHRPTAASLNPPLGSAARASDSTPIG
jgi:F0F1-type ATP synthase membrane subunit c/vacuolar-type H+-ATPase subunit K